MLGMLRRQGGSIRALIRPTVRVRVRVRVRVSGCIPSSLCYVRTLLRCLG